MSRFNTRTNFFSGIVLDLHGSDESYDIEIQRNTSASTSGAEIIATVPGYRDLYEDELPPDGVRRHYRIRHVRGSCVTPSSWSRWVSAEPKIQYEFQPPGGFPRGGDIVRDPDRNNVTLQQTGDLGGQIGVHVDSYELYTYDSSTGSTGGIKVGARKAGTTGVGANATDFVVRKGGDQFTVPGSEVDADAVTDYFVWWKRADNTVSISTDKQDAMDWDKGFFLGDNGDDSFTSAAEGDGTATGVSSTADRGGFQ